MFPTRVLPPLLLALNVGCVGSGLDDDDFASSDDDDAADDDDASTVSAGCGLAPAHPSGGVQVTIDAGPEGDGERGFWLSLPADYDPDRAAALILGYPGTDWIGEWIQGYLNLEEGRSDEIFVYPDPLWRDFPGWGHFGGWMLGPHGGPAEGEQDLVFTEAILDYMEQNYCVDPARTFATGHSWGGDVTQVISCFLGDRFVATVPVAANEPYWFEGPDGTISCVGDVAVWTMFGVADDHFVWQDYPGQFGDECSAFWVAEHGCDGVDSYIDLGWGEQDECVRYDGCESDTRYCLYGPETLHQVPGYYSGATMEFFRSF